MYLKTRVKQQTTDNFIPDARKINEDSLGTIKKNITYNNTCLVQIKTYMQLDDPKQSIYLLFLIRPRTNGVLRNIFSARPKVAVVFLAPRCD